LQIPVLLWFNNRTQHLRASHSVAFKRPTLEGAVPRGTTETNCHYDWKVQSP